MMKLLACLPFLLLMSPSAHAGYPNVDFDCFAAGLYRTNSDQGNWRSYPKRPQMKYSVSYRQSPAFISGSHNNADLAAFIHPKVDLAYSSFQLEEVRLGKSSFLRVLHALGEERDLDLPLAESDQEDGIGLTAIYDHRGQPFVSSQEMKYPGDQNEGLEITIELICKPIQ